VSCPLTWLWCWCANWIAWTGAWTKGSGVRRRGGRRSASIERNDTQRRRGRRLGRGPPMKALRMKAKLQGSTAVAVIAIVVTVILVTAAAMDLLKAAIAVRVVGGRRIISTDNLGILNLTYDVSVTTTIIWLLLVAFVGIISPIPVDLAVVISRMKIILRNLVVTLKILDPNVFWFK
jgi:hypothetical protein